MIKKDSYHLVVKYIKLDNIDMIQEHVNIINNQGYVWLG